MKNFLIFLLSLLLCIGAVGGAYALTQKWEDIPQIIQPDNSATPDDKDEGNTDSGNADNGNSDNGNTDSGNTDSGNTDNGNTASGNTDSGSEETPETSELTSPTNEASLLASGLEMVSGAQLYYGDDSTRPALRFTCNITSALKEAVEADSKKEFAMILIPLKYFDRVNTENYTTIDWMTAFNEAGIDSYNYTTYAASELSSSGENYYMRFTVSEIPYLGVNMEIACIGAVVTTNSDGTKSYQYASFANGGTYRSNARSVAYVASASLNAHTLGLATLSETALAKVQGFVNEAVDLANGLETSTDDNSTFTITSSPSAPQTLSVGESFTVQASYTPSGVEVPIWYRSSDESIVTVDDNGKVTAVKSGTAVIGIYVAGEVYGITVTVS